MLRTNFQKVTIASVHLERKVDVDFYYPKNIAAPMQIPLLLINDGQVLSEMGFRQIFEAFQQENPNSPLLVVGIHAGAERLMEYGTAGVPNYKGQGAKSEQYTRFALTELLLYTLDRFPFIERKDIAYAGFSLGGLSALDIVWNNPHIFRKVGVFSGSFWWRSKPLGKDYDDDRHRIMHQRIRNGSHAPELKFYFECGTSDETSDRNHNGIIDSIDDTLDLIRELEAKGYRTIDDIRYHEVNGGKHDARTWGMCMPDFLRWGWANGGL